jgi:hypothetical protein
MKDLVLPALRSFLDNRKAAAVTSTLIGDIFKGCAGDSNERLWKLLLYAEASINDVP